MAESYDVVRMTALRKVIAARMTEAKQTIPHFRVVSDFEMDTLLALRERTNSAQPECKVSVNDCLIKACATALIENPALNIQFMGDEIHRYHDAGISVVMAVEGGLATPVIRCANRKNVRQIAAEVKALSARAAAKQLKMEEILGGSFSISNLGAHGVDQFDAIINPPQCAILAVGRAKPQLVVEENGETRVARVLRATLSVDHRAIDGATAAAFMSTLGRMLRQPQGLFAL